MWLLLKPGTGQDTDETSRPIPPYETRDINPGHIIRLAIGNRDRAKGLGLEPRDFTGHFLPEKGRY